LRQEIGGRENMMAASSKRMVGEAERRFPCRIKLAIPTGGFGARLTEMHAWLDENCGADGWVMTPAGLRGVINVRSRSTSSMPHWLPPSYLAGAPDRRSRLRKERFVCGRIGRHVAPKPVRTKRFEGAAPSRWAAKHQGNGFRIARSAYVLRLRQPNANSWAKTGYLH
jgi:hypothetical protein